MQVIRYECGASVIFPAVFNPTSRVQSVKSIGEKETGGVHKHDDSDFVHRHYLFLTHSYNFAYRAINYNGT